MRKKDKPMRNPKIFCGLGIDNFVSFLENKQNEENNYRNQLYKGYWTYKDGKKDNFIDPKIIKKPSGSGVSGGEIIDETSDIVEITEITETNVVDEVKEKIITSNKVDISVDIIKDDNEEITNILNDQTTMNIDESSNVYSIDESENTESVINNVQDKMIQSCGATVNEAQAAINIVKDESINTNINNSNVFINTGDNVTITDVKLSAKIDFVGLRIARPLRLPLQLVASCRQKKENKNP